MHTTLSAWPQRGFALLVMMVTVLLVTMLVLAASRTALLDEAATGNDSDFQRAFEAAQDILRAAESDILGEGAGMPGALGGARPYPGSPAELLALQDLLGRRSPSCAAGICIPDQVPPRFWIDHVALERMKKVAATRPRGWYWVELLPSDTAAATAGGAAEHFMPDAARPYIYRITVVAIGRKPTTQAAIQTTLVHKKTRS
ncbi:PilX N-terminal domain-containing pilus assembly protein [Variovorax sp. M-6]|uniref:pilus assembly PilX family protein n=1 Tax=Variovorax sp. M-6 TaxID=3233041 RepID=UPI003F96879D